MAQAKQCDEKQQTFLDELERCGKGGKTVDVIFEDQAIRPSVLEQWLACRAFNRAIERLRRRMSFRLEQNLVKGAALATERLNAAVSDAWEPRSAQVQAMVNTIKLCEAIVRTPSLRRAAAEAKERSARRREAAGLPPGYHRSNTPDQAAALLRRLRKRRKREEKLDRDQDENGTWMPAD